MLSSQIVAAFQSIPDGLVSLGVGLWGVVLARWVFVNRENRRLPRKQVWHETLPLTLVAMLVASVVILDRNLGLSAAAFVGLGVGWVAVLLLDVLGDRITAAFRAGFAVPTSPHITGVIDRSGNDGKMLSADVDLPADMVHLVDQLNDVPGVHHPTPKLTDERPDK